MNNVKKVRQDKDFATREVPMTKEESDAALEYWGDQAKRNAERARRWAQVDWEALNKIRLKQWKS